MIGKKISHFQILAKIGEGGMGEVYLAEDTELHRKVALKFLPANYTADRELNARFKREARAAAALNHPNIITVHEVGEFEGKTYLAMEYVEGESLRALMDKKSMPVEQALECVLQICEGLSKAHEAGIVHRDLKPENVVIDRDHRVRVLDFGLAKLKDTTRLTRQTSTLGTMSYMSPEQWQTPDVDHRTDIWSVGVMMYEMITGELPFSGGSEALVMYSVLNEQHLPISAHRSEIPKKLEQIVDKALMKNPDDRYQTIEDLLTDLQSDAEAIPLVGKGRRTHKARGRSKAGKAKIVVPIVVAAMAMAMVFVGRYFMQSEDQPKKEEQVGDSAPLPAPKKKRVAVAVFENQTGDNALDPVGRMAADWIAQGLAQTNLLHVIPSATVFATIRGIELQNIKAAGLVPVLSSETKSDIVVSGNYYKQDEVIQFQAQVTDLETNQLLTGLEPISKKPDEVISAIAELKQQVMGALASQIDPRMEAFTFGTSQPPNYQVYKEFTDGLANQTRHNWRDAKKQFYRAFAMDTTFWTALLNASSCHITLGENAQVDSVVRFLSRYRERLTPFERHKLDWNAAYTTGDRETIYAASREMATIAPTTEILIQYAVDAIFSGRPQAAIDSVYKKIEYSDRHLKEDWHYWDFCTQAYHMLGNYEEELEQARKGRKLHPKRLANLLYEGRALAALGRIEEISQLLDECLTLPPQRGLGSYLPAQRWSPGFIMLEVATTLRRHGYKEASVQVARRALSWHNERPRRERTSRSFRYGLAYAHYLAGDFEESRTRFRDLIKAYPNNIYYLGMQGTLAALAADSTSAARIIERLDHLENPLGNHIREQARIAVSLGDNAQAINLMRETLAKGFGYCIFPHRDIEFERVWNDPAYLEIFTPRG